MKTTTGEPLREISFEKEVVPALMEGVTLTPEWQYVCRTRDGVRYSGYVRAIDGDWELQKIECTIL